MFKLSFRNAKDPIDCDPDSVFDVINEETNTYEKVEMVDIKGRRIYDKLTPKDITTHDKDFVIAGYMNLMKKNETNLKVKVPKKDDDIRKFFNYTGNKASFDLPIDQVKYYYYEDYPMKMTRDQVNAFLCGYFSASVYVKLKSNGYLSCPLPIVTTKNIELINDNSDDAYNKKRDIESYLTDQISQYNNYELEYNTMTMFVQKLKELQYVYENIGVIQNDKMDKIMLLTALKSPKVSKITKNT